MAAFAACTLSAQAATQTSVVADTNARQPQRPAPIIDDHDVQPRADWFSGRHVNPDVSQPDARELERLYREALRNSEPDHNTPESNDMPPSQPASANPQPIR
jgi:hypothetical protein